MHKTIVAAAAVLFAGKNCSLCTNSNRDVRSKGIK